MRKISQKNLEKALKLAKLTSSKRVAAINRTDNLIADRLDTPLT